MTAGCSGKVWVRRLQGILEDKPWAERGGGVLLCSSSQQLGLLPGNEEAENYPLQRLLSEAGVFKEECSLPPFELITGSWGWSSSNPTMLLGEEGSSLLCPDWTQPESWAAFDQ